MDKVVVANLKMNKSYDEIKEYINEIDKLNFNNKVVICPTSIYLPLFLDKGYEVGIQNVYFENEGSYTGEVSPSQFKSLGLNKVILGHSERRKYFGETNELINQKLISCLNNRLNPIICIGEDKFDYENNLTQEVLKKQLDIIFNNVLEVENIIIAYEPLWAIGSGLIPKIEEITEVTKFIKDHINQSYNKEIKVLYGGSVTSSNIEELNKIPLNGFLVGKACLDLNEFNKIVTTVLSELQ